MAQWKWIKLDCGNCGKTWLFAGTKFRRPLAGKALLAVASATEASHPGPLLQHSAFHHHRIEQTTPPLCSWISEVANTAPELTLAARWLGDHFGILELTEKLSCVNNQWYTSRILEGWKSLSGWLNLRGRLTWQQHYDYDPCLIQFA